MGLIKLEPDTFPAGGAGVKVNFDQHDGRGNIEYTIRAETEGGKYYDEIKRTQTGRPAFTTLFNQTAKAYNPVNHMEYGSFANASALSKEEFSRSPLMICIPFESNKESIAVTSASGSATANASIKFEVITTSNSNAEVSTTSVTKTLNSLTQTTTLLNTTMVSVKGVFVLHMNANVMASAPSTVSFTLDGTTISFKIIDPSVKISSLDASSIDYKGGSLSIQVDSDLPGTVSFK